MNELPAGTIYDIGYQRYHGERLGRSHVVGTLVGHGMRTIFGMGRGERAKIIPLALVALALVPAVLQAWIAAAAGDDVRLVSYHNYFQQIEMIFLLFCAAQAPELVSTDQHNRVLPLYFSRPLHRTDYAVGKLLALCLALLCIGLMGQLILLGGRVFASADVLGALRSERAAMLPILITTAAGALLMSTISLAIASCMKARTMASVVIFAAFIVAGGLTPLLTQTLPDGPARYAVLASPLTALSGMVMWLFEADPPRRSAIARAGLDGYFYLLATVGFIVAATTALLLRYRRVQT